MLTFDRRVICGSATATLGPGLVLCLLICVPDLAVRAWDVPSLKGLWPDEQGRETKIQRAMESVRRRAEAKQAVARDVADERLTLLQAAALMRDEDRRAPDFSWEEFRRSHDVASDDERHCLEVIEHVLAILPDNSPRAEEVVRRLQAEMREHLDRGTLRLPDPTD